MLRLILAALMLPALGRALPVLPSTVSGLVFWADSSYGVVGNPVSSWSLRVGGAMSATGSIAVNAADSGLHNKQTFTFDKGELFTQTSSIAALGTGDRSIFWCTYPFTVTGASGDVNIAVPNVAGTNCQSSGISDTNFWGWGSGDIGSLTSYGNVSGTAFQVMQFMVSGGAIYRWTNNTVKTSGTSFGCNNTITGPVAIGAWQGREWYGRFSEALVYNRAVTESERQAIVEYLLNGMAAGGRSLYMRNALRLNLGSFLPFLFFMPSESGAHQSQVVESARIGLAIKQSKESLDALKFQYAVTAKTITTASPSPTPKATAATPTATPTPKP